MSSHQPQTNGNTPISTTMSRETLNNDKKLPLAGWLVSIRRETPYYRVLTVKTKEFGSVPKLPSQ